jgi:phage baseplate assembly protein gpV
MTSTLTLHAPNGTPLTPGIILNGSAKVEGSLDASSLSSAGAVTAKKSLFVGESGIVCMGGALIGFAAGVPVPGFTVSSVEVASPLGIFGMVRDAGGFLMSLRTAYNAHQHGGVKNGPSLTSLSDMLDNPVPAPVPIMI